MPPRPTFASFDDFFLANVDFWKNSFGFAAGFAAPEVAAAPGLDAKLAVGSFRYAATPRTLTPPKDVIVDVVGREMVVTVSRAAGTLSLSYLVRCTSV